MCTLSVSNVIYHKFSHGAAFYTLNGKNVNVMLESDITCALNFRIDQILGKAGSKNKDVYESKVSLSSRIVKVERQVMY